MQYIFTNINLLLTQSPENKQRTLLYIGLLLLLVLVMIIDSREKKTIFGNNKIMSKMLAWIMFLGIIVWVVLYIVLKN